MIKTQTRGSVVGRRLAYRGCQLVCRQSHSCLLKCTTVRLSGCAQGGATQRELTLPGWCSWPAGWLCVYVCCGGPTHLCCAVCPSLSSRPDPSGCSTQWSRRAWGTCCWCPVWAATNTPNTSRHASGQGSVCAEGVCCWKRTTHTGHPSRCVPDCRCKPCLHKQKMQQPAQLTAHLERM